MNIPKIMVWLTPMLTAITIMGAATLIFFGLFAGPILGLTLALAYMLLCLALLLVIKGLAFLARKLKIGSPI